MLPSINRLTEKADFESVRQNGKFYKNTLFSVSFSKNKMEVSRFGFIVSKKISMKAHERNHIKRIFREFFRNNLDKVKTGYDFVVVAKVGIIHATHGTIESTLKDALKNI